MFSIFCILIFSGGLFLVVLGLLFVLVPREVIECERRLCRKFRIISEDKVTSPIEPGTIKGWRVRGCIFLIVSVILVTYSCIYVGKFKGEGNDFRSAVKKAILPEGSLPETLLQRAEDFDIIRAEYGAQDTWKDVTEQVRKEIEDNILSIMVSNDIAGDPVFGVSKILKVKYRLNGENKRAEVREGAVLKINDPFDELKVIKTPQQLTALAQACPAEVGFFGKNFITGKTVEYRPDQPACLASIVKIFALLEVMRRVDEGTLDLSESISIFRSEKTETCTVSEALDKMIGISDNEATDALAKLVGHDQINALPSRLGIEGLSNKILPEPGVLEKVLDERVYDLRVVPETELLPQHGTARGIVQFFEMLYTDKLINDRVSKEVLRVFDRNPKYFAGRATPAGCKSGGKGGSIGWIRLFHPEYNMVGWGIFIRGDDVALAFCLWCEWFPGNMGRDKRGQWYSGLSDCIVNVLLEGK
jgi:hypothetical protein